MSLLSLLAACHKPTPVAPPPIPGQLLRVGSINVTQADLAHLLKEKHSNRADEATKKAALEELTRSAQLAQAALDADLANDPVVRAETARVLASRLREKVLFPKLKELTAPIPEATLRDLYAANLSQYQSKEKRATAVLWLNPGPDPDRVQQYQSKLASARDFLLKSPDLVAHPEEGFSVLSVDHSEHAASRYQGGKIGMLERTESSDPWTKVVIEIAYTLATPGEISPVITRPEGIFLVRYLSQTPAVQRPLESVRNELEKQTRARQRREMETEFDHNLKVKYPVQ